MDEDAIRGMLWGSALGDALGAPHEFRTGTPLRHYTGVLEYPVIRQNQWQGRRTGVVGQITDDTEMQIALADALVAGRRFEAERVAKSYILWANSGCPFMGTTTRDLFHGVKTFRGYEGRFQKKYGQAHQDAWSQSNGCLMRCAPLAALGMEDGVAAARLDCALSNPHPVCLDACQVYVQAAAALGEGMEPEAVRAEAPEWAATPEVRDTLEAAAERQRAVDRDVTGTTKGWVLHATWCAFRSLKILEDEGTFEDAVDWVVRLGGDTDTNACIAGGLLGASLGYEAMSSEQRTGANIETARAADPGQGEIGRPPTYQAARIDGLARELQNVGDP